MAYKLTIVEDNAPDIFLLEEGLKNAGVDCGIRAIEDGLEARDHFASIGPAEAPDLILLDLNLPKVSGGELLELIRGRDVLASVPVVIWSSARSEQEYRELEQYRIARFISKPNNYSGFLAIGELLGGILDGRE